MAGRFSIGELARDAGVPTSTVRFYEREGLLRPAGRTNGNHRYYDAAALARLRFIRTAHEAGFTLQDIASLLDLRDGSLDPCPEVQTLIEQRLDEIAGRITEFRRVQKDLKSMLDLCRAACDPRRCDTLDTLAERAETP